MPELKKFDYFFLRYAPYPAMDDYVSFGLVMLESAPNGFAGVRFMKNWRRLLCAHPDTDLDYFRFLEQDIRDHLSHAPRRDDILAKMHDCFGNAIQLSPSKECLAENAEAAMDLLTRGSIDLPLAGAKPETGGKRRILNKIHDAFEKAGVWEMMLKSVPAAPYTYPGDPLKIDIAYRPNGVVKMLQAVSLEVNVDAAKALAFSYPQLVAGIARKDKAETALTAVVNDHLDRNDSEIGFALGTLERSGIAVAVAAELPLIAERARGELMA